MPKLDSNLILKSAVAELERKIGRFTRRSGEFNVKQTPAGRAPAKQPRYLSLPKESHQVTEHK